MKLSLSVLLCIASLQAATTYRIREADGHIVTLGAEDYVAAVVSGEAGTLSNAEAKKAMAVAARTYAFRMAGRHANDGFDFCTTTHCQRALPGIRNDAASAAGQATAGEMLWSNGQPAFTAYSQDCGGRSEAVSAVWPDIAAPYLRVHDDPYCLRHGGREWTWPIDWKSLAQALLAQHLQSPQALHGIEIAAKTDSGRAKTLRLTGASAPVLISASTLRFAVGRQLGWNRVRSDRYTVEGNCLRGRGQGHGVGLCQTGAQAMAEEGLDYRAILRFYYPGTAGPSRAAAGFEWTRLGGERITVLTTQPNRDASLPAEAERALRWAEARTHRRLETRLELRIYPDVAAFRNATGEPGWIAGHYRNGRIDLQPRPNLAGTLRHETMHAVLEQHAAPNLPLWFREGLVGFLCGENNSSDRGNLSNRPDEHYARGGSGDAPRRVQGLISRYGETRVLNWIDAGLPLELRRSQ